MLSHGALHIFQIHGVSLAALVEQRLTHLPSQPVPENASHPVHLTPDRYIVNSNAQKDKTNIKNIQRLKRTAPRSYHKENEDLSTATSWHWLTHGLSCRLTVGT
jgi:hypothetical protein